MKKDIFTLLITFIFVAYTAASSLAFELNGCWKSDQKYPLNILRFENSTYHYGKYSQPAKIYKDGDVYAVQFTKFSKLLIAPSGDGSIKITFPDPSLPKNIPYTRVSADEAAQILKKY